MKKSRFLVFVIAVIIGMSSCLAQYTVGVRENRYITADYTFKPKITVGIEQSVFSDKFAAQYLRGKVGYRHDFGQFSLAPMAYVGGNYGFDFCNFEGRAGVGYQPSKRWIFNGFVAAHYDTEMNYDTCYGIEAAVNLIKPIYLVASYGNEPEYRMPQQRVRAGFAFTVRQLRVCPMLSIPIEGIVKTVRLHVSMSYTFGSGKN